MQAMPSLTVFGTSFWVQPVLAFLARTEAAIGQDCEALTDGGRDRMFVSASGCLARSCSVLADAYGGPGVPDRILADQQVGPYF